MTTRSPAITPEKLALITAAHSRNESLRSMAKLIGVAPQTVQRALAKATNSFGSPLLPSATPVDIPNRVRTAEEFKGNVAIRARRRDIGRNAWTLELIREARDAQLRGHFQLPVALAKSMRTEGPLFVAYCNRIAPQSAVATRLVACEGSRGGTVQRKALGSVFTPRATLRGIHGTLANHGIAIGYNQRKVKADGTRVDFRLKEWPLEHVFWNNAEEVLQTTTHDGQRVNIVHGDGDWTVFRKIEDFSWTQDAALLPGGLLWAVCAETLQDWAGASRSHGQPKIVGELPAGLSLQIASGTPSPEALAFIEMIQDLVSGEAGAGLRPAGSKTDLLANGSTAWQVFSELRNSAEKIAARIYLGTDAILGSVGGAPGVDIAQLFGIASTILQGDFSAIEEGLNTGVYQPWAAINYGDSTYAPRFEYLLPDPDAEGKSVEQAAKRARLFDALDRMRALNLTITQDTINRLATEIGIEFAPLLGDDPALQIRLPDSAITATVTGREARTSQGLPPFGDVRDTMTLDEIAIYAAGRVAIIVAEIKAAAVVDAAGIAPPTAPA